MNILALSGSLRAASYNTRLLEAARARMGAHTLRIHSLADIPFYNAEVEEAGLPPPVAALKEAIAAADGLLLATPEYNASYSGVLKNALDWASRPAFQSPLAGKPTALLSASMAPLGGASAQVQLRSVLASTLTPVFCGLPPYLLPAAHTAFDEGGALSDAQAQARLAKFMAAALAWMESQTGV